jgi:hypothetical protein
MPLRRAYAPVMPELDPFLFASVGKEVNGVPLSVLSVLTRLGFDPRDEAARLSHLTREAAADQLARMIARLSDRRWTAAEARTIACGLDERLPAATAASSAGQPEGGTDRATGSRVPVRLIYLVIAGAALIGLLGYGGLSFYGPGASQPPTHVHSQKSADH